MKKRIPFVTLIIFLLTSCEWRIFLPSDKKYPPYDNSIWYSQNKQEDYPNIEIAAIVNEKMTTSGTYVGHILYKEEKIKVDILFGSSFRIGIKYFKEESVSEETCVIPYTYRYKEKYIELEKDGYYLDKFGFDFNNYLPFNLYIKDFNEDEWFTKYPEDKFEQK